MSDPKPPFRLALCQFDGRIDINDNIQQAEQLVQAAASAQAKVVCFPENVNRVCLPSHPRYASQVYYTEDEDPCIQALCQLATRHRLWIFLGSAAVLAEQPEDGKPLRVNRSIVINDRGQRVARYDKIHLFDTEPGDGNTYRESETIRPGRSAVVVHTPFATFGLTICYDLRFPELFLRLAQAGAEVITVPAAFTALTGSQAWHPLLRARAIETGCFIAAAAQHGSVDPQQPNRHEDGRFTFGHSLACDPYGRILVERPSGSGVLTFDLDPSQVPQARQKVPSLRQRYCQFSDLPLQIVDAS